MYKVIWSDGFEVVMDSLKELEEYSWLSDN